MSYKLYVGNLPFSFREEDVRGLFTDIAKIGDEQVSNVSVIKDRETGRPRGFAFVEVQERGDLDKAVRSLNGYECSSKDDPSRVRKLVVNEAQERKDSNAGSGGSYNRRSAAGG